MIKLHHLVLVGILVCLGSQVAVGDPPSFAPYGAWRGRIRYVEGPWRTRTSVNWGNGVTPTGGQVMIQGIGAAQTILTDPNFLSNLSKALGLKEAEKDKAADSTTAADLAKQIDGIRQKNVVMLADLNKVLVSLGLPEQKFETGANAPPSPPSHLSPEQSFEAALVAFVTSAKALKDAARQVLSEGQPLLDNVKNGKEQVTAWNAFAKEFAGAEPIAASMEEPATLVNKYRGNVKELVDACDKVTEAADALLKAVEKLPPSPKIQERAKAAREGVEQAKQRLAKRPSPDLVKLDEVTIQTPPVGPGGVAPAVPSATPDPNVLPAPTVPSATPDPNVLPAPATPSAATVLPTPPSPVTPVPG